jgi:hypothetical protein
MSLGDIFGKKEKSKEPEENLAEHVAQKNAKKELDKPEEQEDFDDEQEQIIQNEGIIEKQQEPKEELLHQKELTLEEIGQIFGVKDPKEYERQFKDDIEGWRSTTEDLYNSAMMRLDLILGENGLDMIRDKREARPFFNSVHSIAELLVEFDSLDLRDKNAYITWKKKFKENLPASMIIKDKTKIYENMFEDYLNVINAYACAWKFYRDVQIEVINNLIDSTLIKDKEILELKKQLILKDEKIINLKEQIMRMGGTPNVT